MSPSESPPIRRWHLSSALVLLAAGALAAYFFWGQRAQFGFGPSQPPDQAESESARSRLQQSQSQPSGYSPTSQPDSASRGFGVAPAPTQAEIAANRVPNEAGIPSNGQPIPSAPRIPVQAAPGEVIGYRVDENGISHPLLAGDTSIVPNSPGTYAVVDPWADGGYAVVPVTKPGLRISKAELERLRARERMQERKGN